jgi:ParB-like chromosome segregation protein Spo0J
MGGFFFGSEERESNMNMIFEFQDGGPLPEDGAVGLMNIVDLEPCTFDDVVSPPQTPEALDAMRLSIRELGVVTFLVVWVIAGRKKWKVVCGNTRLKICKELGHTQVPVRFKYFTSEDAAKGFAVHDNAVKRDLDKTARAMMADALWDVFEEAPDKKEKSEQGLYPRKRASLATHISEGLMAEYRYVRENATDDVKKQLHDRDLSIHAAFVKTRNSLEKENAPSVSPVRTEKLAKNLQTLMTALKMLPTLETSTKAILKALADVKPTERASIDSKLAKAARIIDDVVKTGKLIALHKALTSGNMSTPPVEAGSDASVKG